MTGGNDMDQYSTKDIARLTDIAESTVRKYAQLLEKNGYLFVRNVSGSRIFTEQDLKVMLELKAEPKEERLIEDVASCIASKYRAKVVASEEERSDNMQVNQGFGTDMLTILVEKVKELTDMNQRQMEFNKELLGKLDQQQTYIDQRLEERDRKLMESLRQSQEERQAFLQIATAKKEKKNGFLSRWFGK